MARICISCIKQEIFASTENLLHEISNYISETDMVWGVGVLMRNCCLLHKDKDFSSRPKKISPYILGISMGRELNEKVLLSSDICIEPHDFFL